MADKNAERLRFFGVIKGTEKNYYIAEGKMGEGEEEEGGPERGADFEKGTGVNEFTYWVTSSSIAPWTKLPDLEPKDIAAARSIKVLFTGDLKREIHTNPYFFGREENYLRAQIARITHSTTLSAKGFYKFTEDSVRDIEDATNPDEGEFVAPTTNQMARADMWEHQMVGILKNCNRTTHMESEPPEDSGIEPEDWMKAIVDKDPFDARLKPITDDKVVKISKNTKISPWVVRLMGDATEYLDANQKTVCNGVVVVRSLQWPGSFNFYMNGRVSQIYVGNGHKYEEVSYFPVHPPTVNVDPEEYDIQPEPTPLHEPVKEVVADEAANPDEAKGDVSDA